MNSSNSSYIDKQARKTLESATRPFNVLSLAIMTLLSGALCLVGAFGGGIARLHEGLPISTVVFILGSFSWLVFGAQFLLASSCRTLLRSIRELEQQVDELKHSA